MYFLWQYEPEIYFNSIISLAVQIELETCESPCSLVQSVLLRFAHGNMGASKHKCPDNLML